ncbi:MAG: hypothetical protein MJE77_07530 [Proteobacteria bacterium]|nr:hypothetical protein [Pseudomonadota bacterium]
MSRDGTSPTTLGRDSAGNPPEHEPGDALRELSSGHGDPSESTDRNHRADINDPLDIAVREFYQNVSIRPELVERLRGLAELPAHPGKSERVARLERLGNWRRRAVVAGMMAAAGVAALVALRLAASPGPITADQRALLIAEEIAMNHRKRLDVEFRTPVYPELAGAMDKLDFEPQPSRSDHYNLIGGRYCSIQGSIAAQLKLADNNGRFHTLYQTRWKPAYSGLPERRIATGDVEVQFWREADILFGLASFTTGHSQ